MVQDVQSIKHQQRRIEDLLTLLSSDVIYSRYIQFKLLLTAYSTPLNSARPLNLPIAE